MKKLINTLLRAPSMLFIIPIRLYQKLISPLLPAQCRYYPTCSQYSLEAYRRHGAIKGTVLTAWRILRCNPWSAGGVDHVPEKIRWDYFKTGKI